MGRFRARPPPLTAVATLIIEGGRGRARRRRRVAALRQSDTYCETNACASREVKCPTHLCAGALSVPPLLAHGATAVRLHCDCTRRLQSLKSKISTFGKVREVGGELAQRHDTLAIFQAHNFLRQDINFRYMWSPYPSAAPTPSKKNTPRPLGDCSRDCSRRGQEGGRRKKSALKYNVLR